MTRARPDRRAGGAAGTLLLAMAAIVLAVALMAPAWRARAFDERVEAVATHVDGLRAAAEVAHDTTGRWPPTAAPPGAGVPDLDASTTFEWRRIASVIVPQPPASLEGTLPETDDELGPEPPVMMPEYFERGAISVHSGSEALLARLLERYPGSFVHDTVWTLLLPRVPAPPNQ